MFAKLYFECALKPFYQNGFLYNFYMDKSGNSIDLPHKKMAITTALIAASETVVTIVLPIIVMFGILFSLAFLPAITTPIAVVLIGGFVASALLSLVGLVNISILPSVIFRDVLGSCGEL